MNLQSVTLFGRELSHGNLHTLFFAGLATVALIWVFFAVKRGDRLFPTIGLAAAFVTLFYLTSPFATDAARWWIASGIVLVGLISLRLCRDRVWKPLFIATALVIVLVGVLLTSTSVNLLSFENSLDNGLTFYLLSCLTWLVIRVVIPRTRGKQQAVQVAGLTVVISLTMFIVAAVWWREAIDEHALTDTPIATTLAELERFSAEPGGKRRHGVIAAGFVGAPPPRAREASETIETLARHSGRGPHGAGGNGPLFPDRFVVTLFDGATITVAGITSPRQAHNWPEAGPDRHQHLLRYSDPVVIWAEPGPDPASLVRTRVIAYGTPVNFREDFLSDLIKTSRIISWIAILCAFVALVPLAFGVQHLLLHRRSLN